MAKLSICLVFMTFLAIAPVSAQFDPILIVSALNTGLNLVKYIVNLWSTVFQEKHDSGNQLFTFGNGGGDGHLFIPGPIPDLDFDFQHLGNLSWMNNSSLGSGVAALLSSKLHSDKAILAQFSAISVKLNGLDTRASIVENTLARLVNQLPSLIQWELGIDRLTATMRPIHSLYDTFRLYQQQKDSIEKLTLEDFAMTLISHGTDSVRSLLWQLHDLAVPVSVAVRMDQRQSTLNVQGEYDGAIPSTDRARPTGKRRRRLLNNGIFQEFQDYFTASDGVLCSLSKSPHQVVYDLYTLLALTDAKGYAMMQFSWMLLRLYGKGNFTLESDIARADFEHRLMEKALAARRVLTKLPTWMWKCDAPAAEQRENETFIQFTELLQGYVVNEVDLNHYNTCKESCSSYTNSQEVTCYADQFCSKSRRCPNGRIYNCGFIEADASVCMNDAPGRRYDWIEYKSGRLLGQKSECNRPGQNFTRADSWWRWLFWHCSYCVCLCDEPSTRSDRYVSLHSAVVSNDTNYLMTGLRFIKKDRVVHIQIQEAAALPRGSVNSTTIRWKPVEPVVIPRHRLDSVEDGPGYATLRYEERSLDLDDLVAPDGHVITGLRFRKLGGHLNLEVQVSPIDFVTGDIDSGRATWISNDNTPVAEGKPRSKKQLMSPDIPTRTPIQSVPDSQPEQYIDFQASSLDKDVSQTTVPFLDAQPVFPQPATWITGVGIYHKGQPGYGGYVGFRLSTLNVTGYLLVPNGDINSENA